MASREGTTTLVLDDHDKGEVQNCLQLFVQLESRTCYLLLLYIKHVNSSKYGNTSPGDTVHSGRFVVAI